MQVMMDLLGKQQSQIAELIKHSNAPKSLRKEVEDTCMEASKHIQIQNGFEPDQVGKPPKYVCF